jgi:ABC-2 type transport system ATP-binding protein
MRLRSVAAMLAACAGLAAAPAHAATFHVSTYRVPVTTPDSFGAPVSLDTDVYVPDAAPPAGGYPLLEIFHGGGSSKDDPYDSGHARSFAAHGYVVILYSARGHGNSNGETTIVGPPEIRDLFDVTAWALAVGGRDLPPHPSFDIDRRRIALSGYSQGGLHTNLGQAWAGDPSLNPHGISFRALEPANTPDLVFQALVPNGAVKLAFGVALLGVYEQGTKAKVAPVVDKWIATAAADEPSLYGTGPPCDTSAHDTPHSTMRQDLAWRSVGCRRDRLALPWLWAQAFDDTLFPPDMAISMWRSTPGAAGHRLYLSMGGHAAPSANPAVERDRLDAQMAFLDAALAGGPLAGPNVTYWTRDPRVAVPASAYSYPPGAWYRQTADDWPPAGTRNATYPLGAGSAPLLPLTEDERDDPVARAALASTPLGTSPADAIPATSAFAATFRTPPLRSPADLDGSSYATLAWTPVGPDSQLVVELFDEAPSGALTLVGRGVAGLRGEQPGSELRVRVHANAFSVHLRAGDRVVAWVMAGDPAFYKPYPDAAGGTLRLGASSVTLPLRAP